MHIVNLASLINRHLCPLQTRLCRVGRLENLLELLERLSACLDKEEEDDDNLDANPPNVHKIQLPPNLLNPYRDAIRIHHHGNVQEQKVETRPLCTRAVLQALDRVERLQRSPATGEEDAEEVDGDNGAVREVVAWVGRCRKGRKENVGEEAAPEAAHEHLSAAYAVQEGGAIDGCKHAENGVDGVDEQLLVGVGDARVFDHCRHKVADDIVSAPLAEEGHGDNHGETVARSASVAQLTKVPPWVVVACLGKVVGDLVELELDNG